MKAIGYVRVSTAGQVEDGVSLAAQEDKVRTWAKLHDVSDVVIFRDEGLSGSRSDNRPGLQAALKVVEAGDALVVYSLSRLSRSTKDTLSMSDALQAKDADLVSLSEKIDTTSAAGKMVFRILAVLSEFERDQIADRTKAALAYKQANNQKTGGDVPFGYRVRKGKLYPHKDEQKAVRLVLDMAGKGESLRGICRALDAAGHGRKKRSGVWHPQSVKRIIERKGKAA